MLRHTFKFYRWFVPHHLLCVHHRAGFITVFLEPFNTFRVITPQSQGFFQRC